MKTAVKVFVTILILGVVVGAGGDIINSFTSFLGFEDENTSSYSSSGYSSDNSINSGNIYDYSVPDYAFNNYGLSNGYSSHGSYGSYGGYDSGVDRTCPLCSGNGTEICTSCHGSGRLTQTKYSINLGSGSSTYEAERMCDLCGGSGEMMCWGCYGTGEI